MFSDSTEAIMKCAGSILKLIILTVTSYRDINRNFHKDKWLKIYFSWNKFTFAQLLIDNAGVIWVVA